jgi:hypothetical protein
MYRCRILLSCKRSSRRAFAPPATAEAGPPGTRTGLRRPLRGRPDVGSITTYLPLVSQTLHNGRKKKGRTREKNDSLTSLIFGLAEFLSSAIAKA